VAASPNNITFLGTLAEIYRAADQPRKSQDVYERMLELRPNDPDIISSMKDVTTLVHMSETKIEESQSYRDQLRDSKQAVNLEQENKVVRSEEMIDNLITETQKRMEEQPENLSYVRRLADLYMQKGDFDNAQKSIEKALEKEGGDPALQKMLSDVKIKRVDTRLKDLKADIDKNPSDAQLKQQMAELQVQREQFNLEEAERRVRSYPNDLSFRYELAVLYFRKGRVNEALEQFQVSQRSPQLQIMSLNYLGLCFREQKMHDLAINQFQKAEKASVLMDNNKKEIIYNLGETYEQMGKKDEALTQFKKIYEVDINYRDVSKKIQTLSQL
jgi:tetratricopeptide (TPR) repeat protein